MTKSIHATEYRALTTWLRAERERKALTLRDVGRSLGLPHSWVGKVETGERRLDVAEFVRLCQALGLDPRRGIAIVESALSGFPRAADAPMPRAADQKPYSRVKKK